MDATRSATQGAHFHPDVIYLLLLVEIKKGTRSLWYSQLDIHQLGPPAKRVCTQVGMTGLIFIASVK